jgi:hypothetical protein
MPGNRHRCRHGEKALHRATVTYYKRRREFDPEADLSVPISFLYPPGESHGDCGSIRSRSDSDCSPERVRNFTARKAKHRLETIKLCVEQ